MSAAQAVPQRQGDSSRDTYGAPRLMGDDGLVAVAKMGNETAFDELHKRHAEKMFRVARQITRRREDAEDAVQEAFLSAFRHIQTFDGRSTFSTWLTRIGINSALMILRKKRNSREVSAQNSSESDALWEVKDPAPDPEQQYAEQEPWRLVRDAIAGLRPSIRRAMEMHTLQGLSIEEIASEMGVSVCAAKARLFHARAALRKSKVLSNIRDRHWRQRFSNLQNQLQP